MLKERALAIKKAVETIEVAEEIAWNLAPPINITLTLILQILKGLHLHLLSSEYFETPLVQ